MGKRAENLERLKQELIGKRFGKLTVLNYSGFKTMWNQNRHMWLCQCDCGNTKEIDTYGLTSGKNVSCGCYSTERLQKNVVRGANLSYLTKDSVGKANKSGVKGVTWDKNRNKWMAHIMISRKRKMIGRFDTLEEAIEARKKAENELIKPLVLEKYEQLTPIEKIQQYRKVNDLSLKEFAELLGIREKDVYQIENIKKINFKWENILKISQKMQISFLELAKEKLAKDDLSNRKIGKLQVIEPVNYNLETKQVIYKCKCDCGNDCDIEAISLKIVLAPNCGCIPEGNAPTIRESHMFSNDQKIMKSRENKSISKSIKQKSNHVGVSKQHGKFFANITIDNKMIFLGRFEKEEDAIKARKDAEIKYKEKILGSYTKRKTFYTEQKGVCWNKMVEKWMVSVHVDGSYKSIGYFNVLADAIKARKEAEIKYNKKKEYNGMTQEEAVNYYLTNKQVTIESISQMINISKSTFYYWLKKHRKKGETR